MLPIRRKASEEAAKATTAQFTSTSPTSTIATTLPSEAVSENSGIVGSKVNEGNLELKPLRPIELIAGVDSGEPEARLEKVDLPGVVEATKSTEPLPSIISKTELASTRVLNTVELLTMILKYCPVQTLLCDGPRVNKTWKSIIDTNKNIQHWLFMQPWGEDDYWYTYAEFNPFLSLLSYSDGEEREPGCFYDMGPGTDGDSDEEGYWYDDIPDKNLRVFYELNWRKIEKDERFMRPEASWRRMLSMLPPPREIWIYWRDEGSYFRSKKVMHLDVGGRRIPARLGETYADILSLESDICCHRTRTILRSSERYHVALQINVEVKPINSDEEMVESWKSRF